MKIYSDQGNINCYKLLVANELKSGHVDVVLTSPEEKICKHLVQPKLPVLELKDGTHIFSSNSASRYIFGSENEGQQSSIIDEWLEWEAAHLQPLIHTLCVQSKTTPEITANLHKLLSHLEKTTLNNPQGLVGHELSVADVVVWCCIYPLYADQSPLTDQVSSFPHLTTWFRRIHELPVVSSALARLQGGASYDKIKLSLQSQPLRLPPSAASSSKSRPIAGASSGVTKCTATQVDSSITLPPVTPEEALKAEAVWNAGNSTLPTPRERKHPILPQKGERNIMITSALPYVNNVPHLGNIIGCVLSADVFSRFCRLRNLNSLYICGTDEYGTATETKAMEEGLTPQQICDKYNGLHAQIYQWFNIDFDHFGRTTTQQQTDIAQDIFWKLHKNGFILKDTVDQLLCEQCKRFLADRFVEGICPFCSYEDARGDQCDKCGKLINAVELREPRCKQCKNTPVVKTSQHLFMDLPKLQPLLEKHLNENFERGIWTSNTKVITKSWIRDGLKPRCISRDLKWGTPVPLEGYTDKVFYVWYDAPIGYISITANYTEQWKKWWLNPEQVELYNFMAKDNVPFHSVIFPSTLLGTGDRWTVVNHISATEYLNYEDGKFSKSRGVGVFGSDAMDTDIAADVWRFYLLFLRPEGQDSAFNWDDFMLKNNSELLNNLGNFINRALMFVNNNFEACIPPMVLQLEDKELLALVTKELCSYIENLTNIKLRDGIRNILTISRYGNQYMQAHKPWVKVKGTPEEKARAGTIVGLAANIACLLSVMIQPYMPAVSQTIQTQLNAPSMCNIIQEQFVPYLPPGHHIGKASPLFQKIEQSTIQALKDRFAGQTPSAAVTKDATNPAANPQEVTRLETAVADQGNIVRQLKADKVEKSQINEAVAKLLDLKKQLAAVQGSPAGAVTGGSKKNSKQKGKQGANQNVAKPAAVVVPNNAPTPADPAEVARLTTAVAEQGMEVRRLKTEKIDKPTLDAAIAKLLELKRQLATAQGLDADSALNSGGSKKKNKKK